MIREPVYIAPIRAFDGRSSDQERKLRNIALRAFAALNGWTWFGHNYFGLRSLRERRIHRGDYLGVIGIFDHAEFFKEGAYPVAIVCQPYDHSDFGDERQQLTDLGLEVHTPPWSRGSFYYPDRCLLFVVTRPGYTVKWLPEQMVDSRENAIKEHLDALGDAEARRDRAIRELAKLGVTEFG